MKASFSPLKSILWVAMLGTLILCVIAPGLCAEKDKVLAKIGKDTITEADLEQLANAVPERFRYLYTSPEARRQTIDYIVNVYVMAAEAQKEGLDKNPKFDMLLNFTKKDLLARLYMEKMTKGSPTATEQDAKAFYDRNPDMYETPESVHLHHVLVQTEDQAKDVLKRLKKGEKFSDVASAVSICPSKARGGDLDWLSRGRLVKEVEDVAFSMEKGQVTGPVKSKFGYHVLFLEDKKPASKSSFDEVKDYLIEQLTFQKQQEFYEKLADSLRKKMDVQVTQTESQPLPQAKPGVPVGPTAAPKK